MRLWGRVIVAGGVGAALFLVGCTGTGKEQPGGGAPPVARGPVPSYSDVAELYNQRVNALESLWARAVVRIWFPDREGEEQTEQAEGYFQYIRPDRVNLTLTKVGETIAVLGSDPERYWWIELGKKEARKAHVGEHASADPRRIAELGLPVYPLDLLVLAGLTPLPTGDAGVPGRSPEVRWSRDGRQLVVTVPVADGGRRFWLNPETYEPAQIEALDGAGTVVLSSELTEYEEVAVRGGGPGAARPRVPGEILASINQGRTRVRIRLYDPETGGSRPKPAVFDFDWWVRSHGVENIVDLDRPPVAAR